MAAIEYNVRQWERKRGPAQLVAIQGSLSSGSRKIHPNNLKIKQRWQEASTCEKELLSELRHKKRWKQGGVRNAKANPELNLLRDMQGNKKGFHKYICSTRKTRKNVVPLLNGAGELMTNYTRKGEVLNASASVSTGKPSLWESQASKAR